MKGRHPPSQTMQHGLMGVVVLWCSGRYCPCPVKIVFVDVARVIDTAAPALPFATVVKASSSLNGQSLVVQRGGH